MFDAYKIDPFGGGSSVPGLETFDPYGGTTIQTSAAMYGGDPCDPPIIINWICAE
jgi:hypothetical protein